MYKLDYAKRHPVLLISVSVGDAVRKRTCEIPKDFVKDPKLWYPKDCFQEYNYSLKSEKGN